MNIFQVAWKRIKRYFIRMVRIPSTMGFGVQSPQAYHFIRDVVRDKNRFYLFENNKLFGSKCSRNQHKSILLYYRTVKSLDLKNICICVEHPIVIIEYLQSLLGDLSFFNLKNVLDQIPNSYSTQSNFHDFEYSFDKIPNIPSQSSVAAVLNNCDLLIMDLSDYWKIVFNIFVRHASRSSILIVQDIYSTSQSLKDWKTICTDNRTGVTFDLYDCGIVFFDLNMYKQHYKVNL